MRKNKKPAIASEWRETKEAEDRRDQEAEKEARRIRRAQIYDAVSRAVQKFLLTTGWAFALLVALLLGASLLSYSPLDPGFSTTGLTRPMNLCGIAGAWVSDGLYWLFGFSAWWFVACFAVFGLVCLRRMLMHRVDETFAIRPILTLISVAFLICSSVGLETLQFGYLSQNLPQGAGGLIGRLVSVTLIPWTGIWGATAIFIAFLAGSVSWVFRFSWFDAAEFIGGLIERIWMFITVRKGPSVVPAVPAEEDKKPKPAYCPEPVTVTGSVASAGVNPIMSAVPARKADPAEMRRKTGAKAPAAEPPKDASGVGAPALSLLSAPPPGRQGITQDAVEMTSRLIESKLQSYRINAKVVGAQAGPVITQYWIELADGVKGNRVEDIRKDLTRALAVPSVRVVPIIPGKTYMGLEIPNLDVQRMAVYLSEVIGSATYTNCRSSLALALGMDIAGKPVVIDLAKMPHLLVGGTTGSGKSVCINTMILSLVYKSTPKNLRLVLIDPKTVEFSMYQDIPHLLCPVVTDMNKAANALAWLVHEMDRRYNLMSKLGVRSFDSFNEKIRKSTEAGTPLYDPFDVTPENPEPHTVLTELPYIVCFIDELADLILINRKQVETLIMRLAQKARAAGIHLVLATQRPSVDIVTPLIKANIAARICFQVAGRFDSAVVLDEMGAQDLLGRGDMLMKFPGHPSRRVQGCMVDEEEVLRVVDELKSQGAPEYIESVTESAEEGGAGGAGPEGTKKGGENDPLYDDAVAMVLSDQRASTSYVQRRLNIGYNRAANLLESMEAAGIVSKPNAAGKREILVKDLGAMG